MSLLGEAQLRPSGNQRVVRLSAFEETISSQGHDWDEETDDGIRGSYRDLRKTYDDEGEQDSDIDDENADEVELPEDAYGAAIFALIYDSNSQRPQEGDMSTYWLNLYRLVYVMTLLVVNYIFQFMTLYYINDFVVQPSVHSVQFIYSKFHEKFFTVDGQFMQDAWDDATSDYDLIFKKELCHMVFSKFFFLWLVLMLWVLIMIIEFRKNAKLLIDVFRMPSCPSSHPELMVRAVGRGLDAEEVSDEDKLFIVGLTPFVRLFVFGVILVPKFVIALWLTILGMGWLSATESFSNLILNALALQFVISIDDHLFEALLPETYREEMRRVVLHIPKRSLSEKEQIREDWAEWRTSTVYFVFFAVFAFLYVRGFQCLPVLGVLPYFRNDMTEACEPYLAAGKQRLCHSGFDEGCFPYGGGGEDMDPGWR